MERRDDSVRVGSDLASGLRAPNVLRSWSQTRSGQPPTPWLCNAEASIRFRLLVSVPLPGSRTTLYETGGRQHRKYRKSGKSHTQGEVVSRLSSCRLSGDIVGLGPSEIADRAEPLQKTDRSGVSRADTTSSASISAVQGREAL